jgi:fructose-bisphosphate aldolase class I
MDMVSPRDLMSTVLAPPERHYGTNLAAKRPTRPTKEDAMSSLELSSTARALVAHGKGILAADESTRTIQRRFESVQVPSTEENRRAYRELLFTTKGVDEFISGVIMFDETIRQRSGDGTPFPEVLRDQGIIPGIKVDKGTVDLAGFPGEKVTEGLDGLRGRLAEYRELGARFTKWRAVITIGADIPTRTCIDANAEALARFAALSQEAGLVPIVEPEVLMDGDHTIERCYQVTASTLVAVFAALREHRIRLDGMLLKPNMVLPGKDSPSQADVQQVAEATVSCLRECVPAAVPGIVFLSGGQSDEAATAHLNAMNRLGQQPWQLSFSYGRALQAAALKAWRGERANVPAAQAAFYRRARLNGAARFGDYSQELEQATT